ncbi:MAG TPA: hypothetical protein VD788_06635 [Candidatus Polarisedimenticolaceae bacterium]|nr:hypothetical protein [Candidatus Polarisedimenticolaceae bacterium]
MAKTKTEFDKPQVKAAIKELKQRRQRALEAKDREELKKVRRRIHRLKHELRASVRTRS